MFNHRSKLSAIAPISRYPAYAALLLLIAAANAAPSEESYWKLNYESALNEARQTQTPLLIFFTGSDWCLWCQKLERELFGEPEIVRSIRKYVVPLKLDFPQRRPMAPRRERQNKVLQARFQVEAFPTVILYDPFSEKELWRHSYLETDPARYLEALRKTAEAVSQQTKTLKDSGLP